MNLNSLSEKVLDCAIMQTLGGRQSVIANLPKNIQNALTQTATSKQEVVNIVKTCANYENGLNSLLASIEFYEGESIACVALKQFYTTNNPSANPLPSEHLGQIKLSVPEHQELRAFLTTKFNMTELKVVAFDLGCNYEELSHATLSEFAIGLIAYFEKHDELRGFLVEIDRQRPKNTEIKKILNRR